MCDLLLQVAAVFEACARYMEQQIDDTNCLGILSFARVHHCQHLRTKATEHIEKNFQQVCHYCYNYKHFCLMVIVAG